MIKWLENKICGRAKEESSLDSPPKRTPPQEVEVERCKHEWVNVQEHRGRGIIRITDSHVFDGDVLYEEDSGWITDGDIYLKLHGLETYLYREGPSSSEFGVDTWDNYDRIINIHYPVDRVCVECGECYNGWGVALKESSEQLELGIIEMDKRELEQKLFDEEVERARLDRLEKEKLAKQIWKNRCCK